MCGIFCCFNRAGDISQYRARAIACSKRQRHRGPDWSGCYMTNNTVLVHERLAIVGVGKSTSNVSVFPGRGLKSCSPGRSTPALGVIMIHQLKGSLWRACDKVLLVILRDVKELLELREEYRRIETDKIISQTPVLNPLPTKTKALSSPLTVKFTTTSLSEKVSRTKMPCSRPTRTVKSSCTS